MSYNSLFYLVFLSQILLISFCLPWKMMSRMRYVLETYPPSDYPNLYPKPLKHYEKMQVNFKNANALILLIGFLLLGILFILPPSGESSETVVNAYYLIQMIPLIVLEIWSFNIYALMRQTDSRTVRKAELQPRHLSNFVSMKLFGVALAVYLFFIIFILYIKQFEFSWFGGYTNIVIVTIANLFFAGIVIWKVYGKKKDPYQAYEDRARQIEITVKQLTLFSIALTLYVTLIISLNALNLKDFQPLATSIYFQLLAIFSLFGLQSLRVNSINFEVYKHEGGEVML